MATRAHMRAHGKASPCGHPTDHRDRLTHWLEINLAKITFSHIYQSQADKHDATRQWEI